jgi:hypothetical protein
VDREAQNRARVGLTDSRRSLIRILNARMASSLNNPADWWHTRFAVSESPKISNRPLCHNRPTELDNAQLGRLYKRGFKSLYLLRTNMQTPVLVVGAGPVGLTSAIALVKAGIGVIIVDAAEAGRNHSRAAAIQANTLEVRLVLAHRSCLISL